MKSGRFIHVDVMENSKCMVLDRKTNALIPADRRDVVLMKGGTAPPGPRICWACGFHWTLEEGQEDKCPRCGHPNVVPMHVVDPFSDSEPVKKLEIVLKHRNESPEQTLQRSAKIIKDSKGLPSVKLTVGDLSLAKEQKNNPQRVRQQLQAMDRGLSVGDLSHVTAAKDSVESQLQRAKAERLGLSVGDLFHGRRCTQPNMSRRQELEAEQIWRHREKVDESRRISQLLSGHDEALEDYAEKHLKPKTA